MKFFSLGSLLNFFSPYHFFLFSISFLSVFLFCGRFWVSILFWCFCFSSVRCFFSFFFRFQLYFLCSYFFHDAISYPNATSSSCKILHRSSYGEQDGWLVTFLFFYYVYAGRERDSCFFLQNTTPKLIKAPASLLASFGLRLGDGERGADEVSKHGSSSGGLRGNALAVRAWEGYKASVLGRCRSCIQSVAA